MNRVLWFSLLIGVCVAWLEDNNMKPFAVNGPWVSFPENFDDRNEKVACKTTRHQMVGCSVILSDKDAAANRYCDGNWMSYSDEDPNLLQCHAFTNANTEGHIRAVAICHQTVVYPMEPSLSVRLGPNPEVSCPEGYKMLSCWFHADKMDEEHWINRAVLNKNFAKNSCKAQNCKRCRVQASCMYAGTPPAPSLDTFPIPTYV